MGPWRKNKIGVIKRNRVLSVKNEGVYDMADLPPLGLERGILLEHLSHVGEADLLFSRSLDRKKGFSIYSIVQGKIIKEDIKLTYH
jgi:hypothetical protein